MVKNLSFFNLKEGKKDEDFDPPPKKKNENKPTMKCQFLHFTKNVNGDDN